MENYRNSLLGIRFILIPLFIYSIIGWKTYDKSLSSLGALNVEVETDEAIITTAEPPINEDIEDEDEGIKFGMVENKPVLIGCEKFSSKEEQFDCMNKKIFEHIREEFQYPDDAREMGIQGKVLVKFIINKKGKIGKIEIARGIDKNLDNEAVRIIKKMQDKMVFQPAKHGNSFVNVSYIIPIVFKL